MLAAAERCAGWRGSATARLVAVRARREAESPLESIGRWQLLELGLEEPELQVIISDLQGDIGRVDHRWRTARVVGEADGLATCEPGDTGGRWPLAAEELREDRLRDARLEVVRCTWAMAVHDPAQLGALVQRAFARAAARDRASPPVTGGGRRR